MAQFVTDQLLRPGEFVGETVSKHVAGAILSEVTHSSSRSLANHSHTWPYLTTLLQGFYHETVKGATIVYEPMTAVFHGSMLEHRDEIGECGARFFTVELGEAWQAELERCGGAPAHAYGLHGQDATWLALRLYHEFLADDTANEPVEELLFELCSHLPGSSDAETAEPPWLGDVTARLTIAFRESYSLRDLAKDSGIDPSHLARTFYRFKRRTISDFITRLRVRDACARLAGLEQSLSDIATTSGFADQSHMTRAIHRITGSTPATLRSILR